MDSYNKVDEDFGDYAPFDVGPAEFVNLIRNAEYVLQIHSTVRYFQCFIKNNFLFSHDMQKTVCRQRTHALTVSAKITVLPTEDTTAISMLLIMKLNITQYLKGLRNTDKNQKHFLTMLLLIFVDGGNYD